MADDLRRLFMLDPDVTFLNHGSYGACPRVVFDAWQAWQAQMERQPVAFLDPTRGLADRMRAARVALAGQVGTDPDNIVGLTNATEALNIVAQSLDLRPGDEILTTDHEYAALDKTWAYVARRTGARVVPMTVPLPLTSASAFTDALMAGVTARTRVLFLSHVTSATALVFPIADAIAQARALGIATVIDGAHAPGLVPLDLAALDADYYAGNCHKWMMAPKGSAFLYVRPDLQAGINPLVISHGWTADARHPGAAGVFGNSPFIDGLEVRGTRDPTAWLTVPDAIAFRARYDWAGVSARCHALLRTTAERVAALTGLAPLSAPDFCAPQMAALPVPDCDPLALKRALLDGHGIEIPCYRWQSRVIVRLSVQGYNTPADMDRLVDALSRVLPGLTRQGS
jgi:isopenicillin-N epimerase